MRSTFRSPPPDSIATVVIDRCWWGGDLSPTCRTLPRREPDHQVGEVEVLVPTTPSTVSRQRAVQDAEAIVERVMSRLGLVALGAPARQGGAAASEPSAVEPGQQTAEQGGVGPPPPPPPACIGKVHAYLRSNASYAGLLAQLYVISIA